MEDLGKRLSFRSQVLNYVSDKLVSSVVDHSTVYLFIRTAILNFLLHVFARYPSSTMGEKARDMTLMTLRAMANGGMHDHIAQVRMLCLFIELVCHEVFL